MKRPSLMIVVLLLIGVFLAACVGKSAPTNTPTGADATFPPTKIRIGTDATFPPFDIYNMNQKVFSGFDVELMKAIAVKAGLDVEFVNVGFDRLLAGIAQCQYDGGISAITITDELKKSMNFSDPYYIADQVVVVKKGNVTITGRDQLADMTVGAWQGSPSAIEILAIPGAQLKIYNSFDLAFQDLIAGYIDAVIADSPRALNYVNKKVNNLKIVGDDITSVPYSIAICKNRADLVKKINDGLAAVQADGTLDRLAKKWIIQSGQ